MKILVCNTKGGVGKTTLALQLAVARALAGRRVWAIDGDRQGSLISCLTARSEAGKPAIPSAHYADGPTLRSQLQAQADFFEEILIDAGGRDSTALRAGLMVADIALVPVQPRALDVWALDDLIKLIDEVKSMRDGLRVIAVLNQADPSSGARDNAEAAEMIADYPQFECLAPPVVRRKAYANAAGLGFHVSEMTTIDEKAVFEMKKLTEFLFAGEAK